MEEAELFDNPFYDKELFCNKQLRDSINTIIDGMIELGREEEASIGMEMRQLLKKLDDLELRIQNESLL